MAESLVHRLATCVSSLDIGAPALVQAWLPRGGALVAGPQSLNDSAPFSPQLSAFRDLCAGARLSTAGNTLPARCYTTKAPDWTPSLERFPEDDTRVAEGAGARGVRAALAVPIFGRADASEVPPVAVLEVVMSDECLAFSDLFIAVGSAAFSAGLRSSYNRSFSFAPAAVPPPQAPVLARLSVALAAICAGLALPLAQVWVPCLVADDAAGGGPAAHPAAQLQTRGMPACVADPAMWAYRLACTERALQAGEGAAGAAWQCRSLLWVADVAAMRLEANPLRAFAALMRVAGAAALCVAGGAAEEDCYVVEVLFPRAAGCAAAQLALLSRVQMALEATCAAAGMRCASAADVRAVATAAFGGLLPATAAEAAAATASVNGAAAPPGPRGYAIPPSFFEPAPQLLRTPGGFSSGSAGLDGRASFGASAASTLSLGRDAPVAPRFAAFSPDAPPGSRGSVALRPGSSRSGRCKRASEASRDSLASRGPATAAGFADGATPPRCSESGDDDGGDCVGASDEEEAARDAAARRARRESKASAGNGWADREAEALPPHAMRSPDAGDMRIRLACVVAGLGTPAPEAAGAEAQRVLQQLPARASREALTDAAAIIRALHSNGDANGDADDDEEEAEEAAAAIDDGAALLHSPAALLSTPRGLAPAPPPGPREDAAFATPPPAPRTAGSAAAAATAAAASAAAKSALGAYFSERRSGYASSAAADALLMPPPPPPGADAGSTPVGAAAAFPHDAASRRGASPRVASPAATVTPTATAAFGARGGGNTQS